MELLPLMKSLKKGSHHFKQVLSHIITTSTPLTPPIFISLLDLSLSLSPPPSPPPSSTISLLFTQFHLLLDSDLCHSLISSSSSSNSTKCHLQSVLVFTNMLKLAISPHPSSFPPLIKSIARLPLPPLGLSVHGCIVKSGMAADVFVNTALVTMYCAFSRVDDARNLFEGMPDRNLVSWNAMMTGYVHNRRFMDAHKLFSDMLLAPELELGEVTMVCALSACAHLGALNQGVWIHNYIKQYDLRVNVFVGTALVDMYMKCGVVDEALEVFRGMRFRNVFSWNALISGLAMNGRGEDAIEAFYAMMRDNIKPDSVTFLALLCACCHQGFVDQGRRLLIDMEREFGLRPRIEHYGCMVDLLGRAGLLEEANELIATMPMESDAAVWRALLASCRIHGNSKLAEVAIRKLLELEPGNAENYVLLSNILSREKRWSEIGSLRELMSQKQIRKVPGCSSIEIDNVIYEFVVTQKDGLEEVYSMLSSMKRELMLAGYAMDTDMVSYDLDEEEKENSLMHHSEKLALAFGMLRIQKGSCIRIVKNLRVCKDCHTFFKLVSKVYQREIIVRDRNRFHHFGQGACSCRDYW